MRRQIIDKENPAENIFSLLFWCAVGCVIYWYTNRPVTAEPIKVSPQPQWELYKDVNTARLIDTRFKIVCYRYGGNISCTDYNHDTEK